MLYRDTLHLCWITCIWASLILIVCSDCIFPKRKLQNGHFVYQAAHDVNRTKVPDNYLLRFKCSSGYTLQGAKASLCWKSRWTEKVPICPKMECFDPPQIASGQYVLNIGEGTVPTVGSTVTYTCDVGYELDSATDSVLTCHLYKTINRAQWKGVMPNCTQRVACQDPGRSPDGTRKGDCCFHGDVLEYSCNDDFELVGMPNIECMSDGEWNASRPLCRPQDDHCEVPTSIPHGIVTGEKEGDYYRPYDEVEVLCEPGYRYNKTSEYVLCQEDSKWEDDFGECIESFCDLPEPLENGTIPEIESTNMTTFPYNFDITYICDKGFRLIGDSYSFCDTSGWTAENNHCEVIRCPDPGVPEHGTRKGSSFEIGEKVYFQCFQGYELIGSFERYCSNNGQWTGEVASCNDPKNYCPSSGIPVNGMKNGDRYDLGDKISFRCHNGFTLVGSEIQECLPSHSWSGSEVTCKGPHDFNNRAKISEILKVAIAEKEAEQKRQLDAYNEARYAAWQSGASMRMGRKLPLNFAGRLIFYFAFDASGSVRIHNFRKSVEFTKAIVKRVGITADGNRAGALTFSSTAVTQFLPLRYSTTEDVLRGLDEMNYTGGGTSTTSALTLIREELIPITQEHLGKKSQKSIIFILTDGKANMGGEPEEQAVLLNKAGVEIYCIGITNTVMQDSLYKIASTPKEEHVFILQNYRALAHLVQDIADGEIDYKQCGLGLEKLGRQAKRGRMVGGGQASEPWPWMAALMFKTPDMDHKLQCGGSVINENYILTAAHCLFTDELRPIEPKEIIVHLGLTNVWNGTSLEKFEVERILTHPGYEPGPVYDYDIALLRLKSPIEFKALIRPICLPPVELPGDTSFYKPGQIAVATGWGHAGIVEDVKDADFVTEDNLKEIRLPIQIRERCNNSAWENKVPKSFTSRVFCVGDGNGGNDTCRGDSGGPLMQSNINEEGYIYWTQVGIVSWGIGCGLPNQYGYYTHVMELRPWVMETIRVDNAINDDEMKIWFA